MRTRFTRSTLLGAGLGLLVACGGADPAPRLPDAARVARIQVSSSAPGGAALTEPDEIAAVLALLAALPPAWEPTTANPEGVRFSVSMSDAANGILLVLWVGDGWLMANDMQGNHNARRPLDPAQLESLLARLGVGPPAAGATAPGFEGATPHRNRRG